MEQLTASASGESSEALALIIDGKSLAYALEDDAKDMFLDLAIGCASVICCRSSPKQKALVSWIIFPCFEKIHFLLLVTFFFPPLLYFFGRFAFYLCVVAR